ncbi:MAG: radical SAM protein [Opitutaceae bacterium]|nr:radical SAM protein [Opitutaceae bacterium]
MRFSSAGAHFFDRVSGWNVLVDESVPPKESWARAPRQVSIALTNRCDLACAYCYAPKSREELNSETVKGWLEELDQNGAIGVGFGGGEPTLHPGFVDLCRFASESSGLAVTFTTHGHHLTDELLGELHGHVHFVRISMDGVGATYEALRGRSFAKLCDRVRAARKIVPVGLNVVVNASTFADLPAMTELATDLGATEILLLPEQATTHRTGLDGVMRTELQAWVRGYRGRVRLAISAQDAAGFPTADPFACTSALDSYAHIDARSVLKKTSFDREGVAIDATGVVAALDHLRHSP